MRLISLVFVASLMAIPFQAVACGGQHHCQNHSSKPHHHHALKTISVTPNAMQVTRENGVTVYRGSRAQPDLRAIAAVNARKAKAAAKDSRAALAAKRQARIEAKLDASLAAQAARDKASERQETRRNPYGYGVRYRGNNRFFGRNGFADNSNFSGASVRLRQRSARSVRHAKH